MSPSSTWTSSQFRLSAIIDNQPNSQQQEGVPRGRDPFYVAKKGAVERVRESSLALWRP